MRKIAYLTLFTLMSSVLMIPLVSPQETRGPKIDILRLPVVQSPDAKSISMQVGVADVWPSTSVPMDLGSPPLAETNGGLTRVADVEKLDSDGFLITQDLGFQIGFIAYNIRDTATIQAYYRPEITYWPLHDVEFRHALIHCYDQLEIIPAIYGYIVTPVRSLVPPAQVSYYNDAVPEHPFNPGDPITSPSTEHSSCGILKAAGYTFVDAGTIGIVDDADYWRMPNGDPMIQMTILTPLIGVAPTSYQHVAEFIIDLKAIGLAATIANGDHGLINEGRDFNEYLTDVYELANFDACLLFYGVDRLPTQLYSLLHTSQDCLNYPGRKNAAGVNDPTIDDLCDTVKFNLDLLSIETAAKQVQEILYDPSLPGAEDFALAYMCLYSRSHFGAYDPYLQGVVKSPGYGADNKWTSLNINWMPGYERYEGPDTVVIQMLDDEPDRFNPLSADTKSEWEILAQVYDGLTNVNPYTHYDISWIATDWSIVEVGGGMEIDFTLRDDVYWQDGYQFTAYDVEFCLEFLRDHQVPHYWETSQILTDVVVTDNTHCTVIASEVGLDAFWDFSGLAALLPPQIWDRSWASNQEVLDYMPEVLAYGDDMAPGYSPGPWSSEVPTNLFGTGPWTYQFYDPVNWYSDMRANRHYFMTQDAVQNLLTQMFWAAGDYNRDGKINIIDLMFVMFAYGTQVGDPQYDPDADFNSDGFVDIYDTLAGDGGLVLHFLWQRTYSGYGGSMSGSQSTCESRGSSSQVETSNQATDPTMCTDPSEIVNYNLKANHLFSIDINITNVVDLMGCDFRLRFDSTVLSIVSVTKGDFFGEYIDTYKNVTNNAQGFVWLALAPGNGTKQWGDTISGSGTLATIVFRVQGYGNSSLELKGFTKLSDSHGRRVVHSTLDGYFDNRHPGDVNRDGTVNVIDLTIVSFSYGCLKGEPGYNPDADINKDDFVDMRDLFIVARNLGWTW